MLLPATRWSNPRLSNNEVADEIKKMIKVGSDCEAQLAKGDAALAALMAKNKEATKQEMTKISGSFYADTANSHGDPGCKTQSNSRVDRNRLESRAWKCPLWGLVVFSCLT